MNFPNLTKPTLHSVSSLPDPEVIEGLLQLVRADGSILDTTYGSGRFWAGSSRKVVGCDLDSARAKDICCDFTNLPFAADTFPVVVFDPPFHPYVGSIEEVQYKGMGTNECELKEKFIGGLRECQRVTSNHLIVKCQHFVHNHKVQWMPLWAIEELGEPFEWMVNLRRGKIVSGRWKTVRSLYRNHADWLVFSKKGNHR